MNGEEWKYSFLVFPLLTQYNSTRRTVITIRRILLVSILAMILIGSMITTGCSEDLGAVRGPEIGNLAPDFQLNNLDGQRVSLSDFLGKPVLVNFWTSWCPPCRSEMPFIQDISTDKKWADEGLVVLAIDIGESPSTVREFVKNYGLTFPVLLDVARDVSLEYYVRGIPTTFLIDREGIIQDIRIGPFSSVTEIERSLGKIIR